MNDKTTSYKSLLLAYAVTIGMAASQLFAPVTQAQNFAEGLEDLQEMVLVVERLTEQSESCGLERASLSDTMRGEVQDTGLILTEAGPTLYLNVTTAGVGEICFSSVELSVHYFTQVPHPTRPDGAIAQVVLWDDALVATSELSKHGELVTDLVEDMAGDFVDDWRGANPRLLLITNDRDQANPDAPIMNSAPDDFDN